MAVSLVRFFFFFFNLTAIYNVENYLTYRNSDWLFHDFFLVVNRAVSLFVKCLAPGLVFRYDGLYSHTKKQQVTKKLINTVLPELGKLN